MPQRRLCPHCNQPLTFERFGVRLPELKAKIFDAVKLAGTAGITRKDLEAKVYDKAPSPKTTQTHVWGINELLAHTDWRIRGHRASQYSTYHLVREKQ